MDKNSKIALGIGGVALATGIAIILTQMGKPSPGIASLIGTVTDASTGLVLSDVLVELGTLTAMTDSNGNYEFDNLTTDTYPLVLSKYGYEHENIMITLAAGKNTINKGLIPVIVPPATAEITGVVTDASTGLPLSGVTVTIGSTSVVTDSYGVYDILGIPPGNYTVTFTKTGYQPLML